MRHFMPLCHWKAHVLISADRCKRAVTRPPWCSGVPVMSNIGPCTSLASQVAEARSDETFVALCLLTVTGASLLTQKLGFSDTMGAFRGGRPAGRDQLQHSGAPPILTGPDRGSPFEP